MMLRSFLLGGLCLGLAAFLIPRSARAQEADAQVVARLVEYGQMSHGDAGNLVTLVNTQLRANATRGGQNYDPTRLAVGQALYGNGPNGGPGRNPQEQQERMHRVLGILHAGLVTRTLEVLFASGNNASALCAATYGLTMGSCDALIAAASQRRAAVPYSAPLDGRDLQDALVQSGASVDAARGVVEGVRRALLGVPGTLTNDNAGRVLVDLLEACPGGLSSRESQLRAWHVGPTAGMARCIVQHLARGNRGDSLPAALAGILRLERPHANALAAWVVPPPAPAPPLPPVAANPPPPPPPAANNPPAANATGPTTPAALVQLADQQARTGRLPAARALYEQAIEANPNFGPAFMGLGEVALRAHDGPLAIRAFRRAIDLAPRGAHASLVANLFAGLGDAHSGLRQGPPAQDAYRRALDIDPSNARARQGLQAMGVQVPPAPLAPSQGPPPPPPPPAIPEVPSRDQVVAVLRPLQASIHSCFPNRTGVIRFRIAASNNGAIIDATVAGGDWAAEVAATPELECAVAIIKAAHFQPFTRAEGFTVEYPFSL